MLAVTSLGEAQRYDINSAELQTADTTPSVSNSGPDYTVPFTDATGRTFVAPTDASLKAAASMLVADPATNSWSLPYDTLSSNPAAYPGTMLVNTDLPMSGLSTAQANDYANLLRYAAGAGQAPGLGNGQLPPGYLPMTKANGLGVEVAYTLRAATDVAHQTGQVTPLVPGPGSPGDAVVAPGSVSALTSPLATSASAAASGSGSATGRPDSTAPISLAAGSKAVTPNVGVGLAGLVLPVVLGVGLLGALGSAVSFYGPSRPRRRGKRR